MGLQPYARSLQPYAPGLQPHVSQVRELDSLFARELLLKTALVACILHPLKDGPSRLTPPLARAPVISCSVHPLNRRSSTVSRTTMSTRGRRPVEAVSESVISESMGKWASS